MLKEDVRLKEAQARIGSAFSALPLSPNQITALSLLFALFGLIIAHAGFPAHALSLFILAGAADALDGAVARAKGMVSKKGAYIDGSIDRLVELLFILSFFSLGLPPLRGIPAELFLILILFFGSAMTSFATAYAHHRGVADEVKISRQPGILPRTERLMLLYAAYAAAFFSKEAASTLLLLAAFLSMLTFFQRFLYFAKEE